MRAICEDESAAARSLDPTTVRALHARLADLRAADSVRDLIVGQPQFSPDGPSLTLDVTTTCYLHCQANQPDRPAGTKREVHWDSVHRIQVMDIVVKGDVGG